MIALNEGNGAARTLTDTPGSGTYTASGPYAQDHWIVRTTNSYPYYYGQYQYTQHFRLGGAETYDSKWLSADHRRQIGEFRWLRLRRRTLRRPPGCPTGITGNGWQIRFGYTGSRVTSLIGPDSSVIANCGYDGSGRLQTVTYADRSGYAFTYDANNLPLTVSDLTGQVLQSHTCSGTRALTSEIASGQERRTLSYGANQTTVTDALGHVTTYDWQAIGGENRVTRTTGACACGGGGISQSWTCDPNGRM